MKHLYIDGLKCHKLVQHLYHSLRINGHGAYDNPKQYGKQNACFFVLEFNPSERQRRQDTTKETTGKVHGLNSVLPSPKWIAFTTA